MGLIKEFKEFALKGNVVDMAVGIVIGGAFSKIVTSLVGDVIMPLVGAMTDGGSLAKEFLWLGEGPKPESIEKAKEGTEAFIGWGSLTQTVVDFFIIALAIFVVIKIMNTVRKRFEDEQEEAPEKPSEEVQLLTEIRDALKKS